MPKTTSYIARDSKNGEFSPRITKDNNIRLDIFCKINGLNKSQYVNDLVAKDMDEKFGALKMTPDRQLYL